MSPAIPLPCPWTCPFQRECRAFLKDLNGWSLTLTGQDSHCWSLHFSPLLYLVQMALYSSFIFCTLIFNSHSVLTFGHIHIKSCKFFNHLIDNSHFIFYFFHCIFSTLFSFWGTKHFKGCSPTNKPKWISLRVNLFGIFKLFAPVCWWLDWFVCDCKYFHDHATLL